MSFEDCARIVERADPDRFQAAMSVPLDARRVLMPLYAFNAEVVRAPWVTQEAMIAEMRLQWWRDVLEEIAEGRNVRRHEVATPLAEVLTPDAARHLDEVVTARQWDIYRDPFVDDAARVEYLTDTTARIMQAAGIVFGRRAPVSDAFGFGVGLSRFLTAVPALIENGRRPIPLDNTDYLRDLCRRGLSGLKSGTATPECREAAWAAPVLKAVLAEPSVVLDGVPALSPLKRSLRLSRFSFGGKRFDR